MGNSSINRLKFMAQQLFYIYTNFNTRDLAIYCHCNFIHVILLFCWFAIIVTNCISFYLYLTLTDLVGLQNRV
jgi:hypothetical protein